MQRGIALKAPYGTVFVAQKDGSIWLIYDSAHITTNTIVDHFRNALLEHQAQAMASDMAVAASNVPKEVSLGNSPVPVTKPIDSGSRHDWNGPYRMAAVCKVCGVVATGTEQGKCEGK
jgi:hypothetical protein